MSDRLDLTSLVGGIIIGAMITAFCFIFNCDPPWVSRENRAKAIERGAAYWNTDQKTGQSTFTWKEIPKP